MSHKKVRHVLERGSLGIVRVSKSTLRNLEKLRDNLNLKSLDETIRLLLMKHRRMLINDLFGIDAERINPFTEEDRGEDRS